MNTRNTHHLLAGAIALAFAGGQAFAGGPVGTMPFDGDETGNGFTIDNAGFSVLDVTAAPCPTGATCVNGSATTGAQRISGSPVDVITEDFDNPITFAAGDRISATWIGAGMFSGGPGILLADGQEQNHDARTPEQTDFGLLIYRVGGGTGTGDYGGLRAGVDAEFSQNAPTAELRGFAVFGDNPY